MSRSNSFDNDHNDQIDNTADNTQHEHQSHVHESNPVDGKAPAEDVRPIGTDNVNKSVEGPKVENKLLPPPTRQQVNVEGGTVKSVNSSNTTKDVVIHDNKSHRPPLYPKGPDGKFDFSKSPAQQANPDKIFDSDVTVCYRDVNVSVRIGNTPPVPTHVATPFVDLVEACATKGASCARHDFYRIKDVSGVIRPGTMTLVLSGPGEGKSTYLRALANRIPLSSGRVVYNGRNFDEAAEQNVDLKKMTAYVDQVDTHLHLLTVHETLEFAAKMTSVNYNPQKVEDVITLLGLEECRNTIIGNHIIRGISGGQRHRVTTGELLVSDASVLFLDEYSNGLDSSTALDIAKGLKKFCLQYNSSIVATLQQPTPELFEMFDRIVVLREGQVVFDGPVDDVVPYFAGMGFNAPDDVDTADFLIDCLSQPRSVILRQKQEELRATRKAEKLNKSGTGVGAGSSSTSRPVAKNKPKTVLSSYGEIQVSPSPCITTEEMVEYYQSTPQWEEIKEQLDKDLPLGDRDANGNHLHPEKDFTKYKELIPTDAAKAMYKSGYRLPPSVSFKHTLQRSARLFIRNKQTLIPRFMMAAIMSLFYGSLYWQIHVDNYVLRLAAFVVTISQISFANFIEMSISVQGAFVVKKQLSANFYRPHEYAISQALMSLPMALFECFIAYTCVLYWMMGNNPTAGSFFASFIVLFCTSVALGSYFRFLAVLGGNESTANAMAGPSTGIMLIFSGLFITRSQVRNFMIWLYWISPFSWSCRALANNEFSGSRYDFIIQDINGENARAGTAYLGMIDMYVGKNWILYACIYLVALTLFLVACCSFLLRTHFYEESIGTRRINDSEIMDDDSNDGHDDNITNAELKAQVQAAAIQQAEILEHSRNQSTMESKQISTVPTSATGAISSGPGGSNTLQTLREALPFTPAWMSFSDISYTVKVPKGDQMVDRILLHNVNGYAQPGKLLALMGASGAGKTTLLDVIAGLKNTGVVQGKILINGQEATKNLIATMCGYVEQFDTLFAYSTVRETLLFAARLRLPRAVSDEIKEKIVDEILDILDLTSMANFIIGNQRIIGLSPAQCKRVNIGLELVANPSILFLDEPTTGLDSKNSMTVMKVVKRIARSGRAIICTIHQPSAELFFLFDRLLLLGAGGHQIYFGDLGHRASKFVKYLSRCPGITPIKSRVNPASWMLVELGVGVAAEKGDDAARFENATVGQDQLVIEEEPEWASLSPAQRTVQKFTKMYKLSDQRAHAMKRLEILESIQIIDPSDEVALAKHKEEVEMANLKRRKRAAVDATENEASKTLVPTTTIFIPPSRGASLFTQFSELYKRNMMAYWRNQGLIYSRAIVTAIMSLICGLVYLNVRKKIIGSDTTDLAAANSLVGAILMVSVFPAIGFLQTSLPLYFEQRVAFYREKASGFYFPTFYALCQVSIEIPWCLLNLIFGVLPSYFLLGLKPDAGAFFGTCICLVSIFLVYSSLASFLGNSCPSTAVSQPLAGAYMSLQNSLTGVSITSPNLPRAYRYSLYQIFPVQHLLRFPVLIQTKGVEVPMKYFKNGEVVDTTLSQYVSNYLGWGYDDMWHHLGWAWLYICVLQVFSALAITFISHFKR